MQQEQEKINPQTLWHTFPVTQKQLAAVFCADVRTVRRWINGESKPSGLVIEKAIALYDEWSANGVNLPAMD